jgi:hypothetical protein
VRFRQDWIIADDAAEFFFPPNAKWTTLTEVRLADRDGKSAGNIDVVLVAYDDGGKVYDFGALEVQAVYISGLQSTFDEYMTDPRGIANTHWRAGPDGGQPNDLRRSFDRVASQSLSKNGILQAWQKKTVVALNRSVFTSLLKLDEVSAKDADIAWMVYDLNPRSTSQRNSRFQELVKVDVIYTRHPAAAVPNLSKIPDVSVFLSSLSHSLETIAA